MADLATISAALGSLKTATEIVKLLRESDVSLERAELKLKLADLVGALADLKMELAGVQEALVSKDKIIEDLQIAFETKHDLIRRLDAYYEKSEAGEPIGAPYCSFCWENSHIQRHLVTNTVDRRKRSCTTCGNTYDGMSTYTIQARVDGEDV
tara:strand:- start:1272 stop:1730 length:459 start_codon:yes stop_codon:yes gene_type:complete